MLLPLLLLAVAGPQEPKTIRVEPIHQDGVRVGLYGAVEAPTQPTGRSTALVVRTPRVEPTPETDSESCHLLCS